MHQKHLDTIQIPKMYTFSFLKLSPNHLRRKLLAHRVLQKKPDDISRVGLPKHWSLVIYRRYTIVKTKETSSGIRQLNVQTSFWKASPSGKPTNVSKSTVHYIVRKRATSGPVLYAAFGTGTLNGIKSAVTVGRFPGLYFSVFHGAGASGVTKAIYKQFFFPLGPVLLVLILTISNGRISDRPLVTSAADDRKE